VLAIGTVAIFEHRTTVSGVQIKFGMEISSVRS